MMQQQPMMSPQGRPPQGRPPQGAPRQGIAQLNPNVPMQTQLNQLSKLPPQQLEARKNESFLAAIAAEQQAAKAEAAQREKLMLENPELATDEKIIDRLRQSTIASMMPPTNPMPSVMDKAQGVAGVLQNKTAKRKRSMNNLANAGLPATGKPPMKSMASGGILGYKDGGYVPSEEEIAAYLRENPAIATYDDAKDRAITALTKRFNQKSSGLSRRRIAEGITDEQIDKVLDDNKYMGNKLDDAARAKAKEALIDREERKRKRIDPSLRDMAAAQAGSSDLGIPSGSSIPRAGEENASLAIAELERQEEIQKIIDSGGSGDGENKSLAAAVEEAQEASTNPIPITPAPLTGPAAGPAGATAGPAGATAGTTTGVPTIEQMMQKDYTKNVEDDQLSKALGDDLLKGIKDRANVNPMDRQMEEEGRLDARFNPEDRIGKLGERQQKRMQDYLTERESPERQAYLKRLAMYNSMGKGGLGSIVGGMNRGLQNYERAQDKGKGSGLGALTALEDTDISRKTKAVQDSTAAAATLGDRIAQQQDSAVSAQINVSTIDLNAAKQDVKNAFDRDIQIAGMSAKQYANELSANMNMLIKEANNTSALAQVQKQLNEAVETAQKSINDKFNSSRINSARNKLDDAAKERLRTGGKPESPEEELLQDAMAYKKALEEQLGIAAIQKSIAERRNAISGGGSSGTAILNPAQQAALEAI